MGPMPGKSERQGGEAGLQIQAGPSVGVDLELRYARGRYRLLTLACAEWPELGHCEVDA